MADLDDVDDFEFQRRMIGVQLHEARRLAAERFQAVAAKYLPEGCAVEYRKSLSGRAGIRQVQREYQAGEPVQFERWISAPKPVTRKALYIYLHECAHHALGHIRRDVLTGRMLTRVKPKHVSEMEAEKQAHEWMRAEDIAVPRSMTKRAREYVGRKIHQAKVRGAKRIDPEARRFSR